MAQAMVNFRMDEDLKKNMEQTCKNMGAYNDGCFYHVCDKSYAGTKNTF